MKVSLITTTIRVPKVLEVYREMDKSVKFYVTGDYKTPKEAKRFVENLGNAVYYDVQDQKDLGYKCSEIIGWNKIMRRNIALLEAIKDKPDIIISIDDDNIPIDEDYFNNFTRILLSPYSGFKISSEEKWFNVGDFMNPQIYHRGFPYSLRFRNINYSLSHIVNKKVGIAAGMWLGDPDIDTMERIVKNPIIQQFSEMLIKGIILEKNHFSPIDSQNTGFVRELAPLMMVLVDVGRYDDIWASFISERIMRTTDYYCHFGKPFVWQERNRHNLWKNLRDELFGMEYTERFCKDINEAKLEDGTVVDKLESLYEHLKDKDYLPAITYKLGKMWCKEVREIL